jgi:hypothetical protein
VSEVVSRWHGVSSKNFFSARNAKLFTVQGAIARSRSRVRSPLLVAIFSVTLPSAGTLSASGGVPTSMISPPFGSAGA